MNQMFDRVDRFGKSQSSSIKSQGIKYIGSKLRLMPHILELADSVRPNTVLDGFSGSTRVSQAFAQMGYAVVSSDISVWSEVFANCYLRSDPNKNYQKIIDELNCIDPVDGWFTQLYGGDANDATANGRKNPWQVHNTRKLDGIRERIDYLDLTPDERAVCLTSLICALDKVDSTLGHFSSYLAKWSARSNKIMQLEMPKCIFSNRNHEVIRGDIFDVVKDLEVDLAYLDPPYGSNNEKMPPSRVRYSAYYHLWTTVCLNDRPEIFGKVNRREDTRDKVAATVFEDFRRGPSGRFRVVEAIEDLIAKTNAKHIILSYSSGGRATAKELSEVLENSGEIVNVIEVEYKRNVMAGMRWTNEWTRENEGKNIEYLFLLKKK